MGGKRKSGKRVAPKRRVTVPKTFKCPFCSHDASCEVTLSKSSETGYISCRVCGEDFHCRVTYMSDPVDVYCEWLDACNAARDGGAGAAAGAGEGGEPL